MESASSSAIQRTRGCRREVDATARTRTVGPSGSPDFARHIALIWRSDTRVRGEAFWDNNKGQTTRFGSSPSSRRAVRRDAHRGNGERHCVLERPMDHRLPTSESTFASTTKRGMRPMAMAEDFSSTLDLSPGAHRRLQTSPRGRSGRDRFAALRSGGSFHPADGSLGAQRISGL